MNGQIRWDGDVRFEAQSGSGHTLMLDGPPSAGGTNAGVRPMELLLLGVGGCASYDVVTILQKARQPVTGCTARVEAERAAEPPKVFTRVNLHFVVEGHGLSDAKVERAVHLSADKYCSASIMLQRGGVEVSHSFEVLEAPSTGEIQ
ncbi:MAG: peroxiredoxin [Deltaproteobacteria bacterium]|nr:peroxiredoxin [Deltaproteobacteria bacterium]HCH63955.1 OsmC family protein [Deltaproteobacteria bacterium]